jgi:hypothetical protein
VADAHTRILAVGKEALGDGAEHLPTGGVMRITVKAAMIKACERLPAPVPEVVAARLSR